MGYHSLNQFIKIWEKGLFDIKMCHNNIEYAFQQLPAEKVEYILSNPMLSSFMIAEYMYLDDMDHMG